MWPTARVLLAAYLLFFIFFTFVWRSLAVYRRTGVNPLVLPSTDDAYGYVGRAMKVVVVACGVMVVVYALGPELLPWLGPIMPLQRSWLVASGWVLLLVSLVWTVTAQIQMGASWRIGIDAQRRTELVQHGLFSLSRNPIFLALRVTLLGLFLIVPAAATLALLVAAEVLMQVQVRLEELHLRSLHGEEYELYRKRVRRWL